MASCIQAILCPLGEAVINAVKGVINATIAYLDAQILMTEAALFSINPAVQGAQLLFNIAEAAINEVREYANLIPAELADGSCLDLGKNNRDIRDVLEDSIEDVKEFKRKLIRQLSLKHYYEDLLEYLQDKKEQFQDFLDTLTCEELLAEDS